MLADEDGAHPHVFSVSSVFSGFCCVSVMVASERLMSAARSMHEPQPPREGNFDRRPLGKWPAL